jgi:hypothetical protein
MPAVDHAGMATMLHTTEPPTGRISRAIAMPAAVPARGEGQAVAEPGSAARELDAEVTRLLRVRGGELAEPLLWQRPSHRREVDEVIAHLQPIRSRIALLSSWTRESQWRSPVRLAYAIAWLRLAGRRAGEYGPRARNATPETRSLKPRRTARRLAVTGRG